MAEIFDPILEEELRDIILFDLHAQNPKGNDLKDARRICQSYNLGVPDDRLGKSLEFLREERLIRQDPNDVFSISLTDKGAEYVADVIAPKVSSIPTLDRKRLESIIKSYFKIEDFQIAELGDGFKVSYFPESRLSYNFFSAFRWRNTYYTFESHPGISLYRRTDVSALYKGFEKWLVLLKQEPSVDQQGTPTTTTTTATTADQGKQVDLSGAKGALLIEGGTNLRFRNETMPGVLDVQTQANIFKTVLESIPQNEKGTLFGIFGQWGRGKTYFWQQLKELLKQNSQTQKTVYEPLEFHAWKFQDTPASWAYLYEIFAQKYYERPRKLGLFPNSKYVLKAFNLFKLNIVRSGWKRLITSALLFVFLVIWYFVLGFHTKFGLFAGIITFIGVPTLIGIYFFYRSFKGTARELFERYFTEPGFKNLLGIQAEIQNEFSHLLRAWISDAELGSRKIVLFVDDIDRCSEDRIIQVIDSLKVMMDDSMISKRVIVLAAVDGAVLQRAIKHKYYDMVQCDLSLDGNEEKTRTLDQLCREYMDKLFLIGLKLGSLSSNDKLNFIKAMTEGEVFFRNSSKKEEKFVTPRRKPAKNKKIVAKPAEQPLPSTDVNDYISLMPNKDYQIMDFELDHIIAAIAMLEEPTPRSIRIFYYRYLLAKFFKDIIIKPDTRTYNEWNVNQSGKLILSTLIVEYSIFKKQRQLVEEIERVAGDYSNMVDVTSLDHDFKLSRELYLEILKIVEMVVPY